MFDIIKSTFKHTAIYSIGSISPKLIGIILLPIYTKWFTPSEYGIFGILEITIYLLTQILLLGQPESFLRLYNLDEYIIKRKSTLFNILILLFTLGVVSAILGELTIPFISPFFSDSEGFALYLRLITYVISFRLIGSFFIGVLRAKEKSGLYSFAVSFKFLIILLFNIHFIVFKKLGIVGIFYSYIIGEVFLILVISPFLFHEIELKFDRKILTESLAFGVPIVFLALGAMIMNVGDRYILKILTNYREVGLYELGYRFGSLLNLFLVQSFALGYLPQAYKIFGEKNDKRYFSKMNTYFVFILCWSGLAISIFSKEVVQLFALDSDYWSAYKVVPIIVLAYIFNGIQTAVSISLFLTKKTQYIAYTFIFAAAINIGLNFLLIPYFGKMGAAMATLLSFLFLYLITYYFANRFYHITYENFKLFKLLAVGMIFFIISLISYNWGIFPSTVFKLGLIILYPISLYPIGFYEPVEVQKLLGYIRKVKRFFS